MAVGVRTLEAGRALIRLALDDDALRSGLRSTERRIRTIGRNLASAGAAVAGVGAAITAAFIPAVQAAARLEEATSKFDAVFGSASESVRDWGNSLAEEVNRGKGQINSFLADSQAFFVPLGLDDATARDFSKTITALSIDLASFYDKADERQVLQDLQSAFAGSLETLKKYGVALSVAKINQELLNKNIDPKTATEAQKATAILTLVLERTAKAQGDAARTSGSFSNQLKGFQGQVADLSAVIGSALIPPLTEFLKAINAMVAPLAEWAKQNESIVVAIAATGVAIAAAGAALIVFGAVATGASAALGALAAVSGLVSTALATLASPIGIIAVGLGALVLSSEKVRESLGDLASITLKEVQGSITAVVNALSAGDIGLAFEVFANQIVLTLTRALSEGLKVSLSFIPGLLSDTLGDAISGSIDRYFGGFIEDLEKKQARLRNETFKARKEAEEQAAAQRDAARATGDNGLKAEELGDIYKKLAKEAANSEAAIRKQTEAMVDAAKRLEAETRTPLENYLLRRKEINDLFEKGFISGETADRALKKEFEQFEKNDEATQRAIENEKRLEQAKLDRQQADEAFAESIFSAVQTPAERIAEEIKRAKDLQKTNPELVSDETLRRMESRLEAMRKRNDESIDGLQRASQGLGPLFGGRLAERLFGQDSGLESINQRMLNVQEKNQKTSEKIERNTRIHGFQ